MSDIIKKPSKPIYDIKEFDTNSPVIFLYIVELLEAIAKSQGIELEEPD